jgi:hypothetical protein
MGNPTNMSGDQMLMDTNMNAFNTKWSAYLPLFTNNEGQLTRPEFFNLYKV